MHISAGPPRHEEVHLCKVTRIKQRARDEAQKTRTLSAKRKLCSPHTSTGSSSISAAAEYMNTNTLQYWGDLNRDSLMMSVCVCGVVVWQTVNNTLPLG